MTIPAAKSTAVDLSSSAAEGAAARPGAPALLSVTSSGSASRLTLDLLFDMTMAAGHGFIIIGADHAAAAALPAGLSLDTRVLPVAAVEVDGSHVRIVLEDLLPGHSYSIAIEPGVLVSGTQQAFAGLDAATAPQLQVLDSGAVMLFTPAPAAVALALPAESTAAALPDAATVSTATAGPVLIAAQQPAAAADSAAMATSAAAEAAPTALQLGSNAASHASLTSQLVGEALHVLYGYMAGGRAELGASSSAPLLLSATPSGGTDSLSFDLNFSAAMRAGTGVVYVTDGALQTVIDRVSGLPTMRIVGADDTRTISAASLKFEGSHVIIELDDLLPGRSYSVVMANGVLVSADGSAFTGIRNSAALHFDTPPAPDTSAPSLVSASAGGTVLAADGSVQVTIKFSEAVPALGLDALQAPHATVSALVTHDGGLTWVATLTAPPGTASGATDTLTLDMSKVHDASGNAGSGNSSLASYTVDSIRPIVTSIAFDGAEISQGHGIGFSIVLSEAVKTLAPAALDAPHATVSGLASSDGGRTWTGTLVAADAQVSTGNQLSVDMSKLLDLAGNAGSGIAASPGHYGVNAGPLGAELSLDGGLLLSGGSLTLTVAFTHAVTAFDATMIAAPHAAVVKLEHAADYTTWYVTLAAADAGTADDSNAVSIDMSKVFDTNGNAGNGQATSGNYAVDTTVAAYVAQAIHIADAGPFDDDLVTNASYTWVAGALVGAVADGQYLELKIDGERVDPGAIETYLAGDGILYWGYSSDDYLGDGVHTIGARVVDDSGHASGGVAKTFTVDTAAPHVSAAPDSEIPFDVGSDLVIQFDEAVYWTDGESTEDGLVLYNEEGGSIAIDLDESHFSSDHQTLTISANELHLGAGNDYYVSFPYNLTDLAGNEVADYGFSFHTSGSYEDVTPPTATRAMTWAQDGTHFVGETIEIRIRFNEPVKVVGEAPPVLNLSNGAQAIFNHVSDDQRELVFIYTIAAGDRETGDLDLDNTADLVGHVADLAGHPLDLAHVSYMHLQDYDGYGTDIAIDTHTPPLPAPQLATWSDSGAAGDNLTSVVMPDIVGSGAAAGTRIDLYEGSSWLGSTTADAYGSWQIDDVYLDGGTHVLNVRQLDEYGYASRVSAPLTLSVEPAAPASAALASDSGNDLLTNDPRPTLTGTVDAGVKVAVWDGSTRLGEAAAGGDGTWSFTPAWNLAHGGHWITLELTDANGNVTPRELSDVLAFNIDLLEPDAPGTPDLDAGSDSGSSSTDNITNDATPTITGVAAEAGGQVEVYEGGTLLGKADVAASGAWSFTFGDAAALADGVHALAVRQVDAAGNRGAISAPLAITVDTAAPTIVASESELKSLSHWFSVEFSEQVVFAQGAVDVLDLAGVARSHHLWNVLSNWELEQEDGHSVLELNLGLFSGLVRLQIASDAIQDVAGNAAIIGSDAFTIV
jgi:hypothetical protein